MKRYDGMKHVPAKIQRDDIQHRERALEWTYDRQKCSIEASERENAKHINSKL